MQSLFSKARRSMELHGEFAHGAVADHIASSWQRCLKAGIDPLGKPTDAFVSHEELRMAKESNQRLIEFVRPELELLSSQIAGSNFMTAFSDGSGLILDTITDSEFQGIEAAKSIQPGSIWTEEYRGTNGFGLALYTGETSVVNGREHFFKCDGSLSCISTPIINSGGQIIGVIDAASQIEARQYHTKALVNFAAVNIENRLFIEENKNGHVIVFHPRKEYLTTQSVGMICVSSEGEITGANRRAGELISGLTLASLRTFADIFQTSFSPIMTNLQRGETVKIIDWLNSSYFARLSHMSVTPASNSNQRYINIKLPAIRNLNSVTDDLIYRDEVLFKSVRIAEKAARLGAPICIHGRSGSGRTTFARYIHGLVNNGKQLLVIDCSSLDTGEQTDQLAAQVLSDSAQDFTLNQGGSILLEELSQLRTVNAEQISRLMKSITEITENARWQFFATDLPDTDYDDLWTPQIRASLSRLTQLKIDIPDLNERTDFGLIATNKLRAISSDHKLHLSAVKALNESASTNNFNDLFTQLQVLAVNCPPSLIRDEEVQRILGHNLNTDAPCERCIGKKAREIKCIEIRRTYRKCNSNVALAARKLGIARNTVYQHIAEN